MPFPIGVGKRARRLYVTWLRHACEVPEGRDRIPDQVLDYPFCLRSHGDRGGCPGIRHRGNPVVCLSVGIFGVLLRLRRRSLSGPQLILNLPRRNLSSPVTLLYHFSVSLYKAMHQCRHSSRRHLQRIRELPPKGLPGRKRIAQL